MNSVDFPRSFKYVFIDSLRFQPGSDRYNVYKRGRESGKRKVIIADGETGGKYEDDTVINLDRVRKRLNGPSFWQRDGKERSTQSSRLGSYGLRLTTRDGEDACDRVQKG